MTLQLPLRQPHSLNYNSSHQIAMYIAGRANPLMDPDEQLRLLNDHVKEKRVRDVFFLDNNGQRAIWGQDIDYYQTNPWDFRNFYEIYDCGKKYWFRRRSRKHTLAVVDKPKSQELAALVAHPSEKGWNLPTNHKYHLLNMPLDIRLMILEQVLCLPGTESVMPNVVTCNWKKFLAEPSYRIYNNTGENYIAIPTLFAKKQTDEDGDYTLLFNVHFKALDASCLRVCKQLYSEGIGLLYGKNNFDFRMVNEHYHGSPPSYFRNLGEYRPDPLKPTLAHLDLAVARAIPKIEERAHLRLLPGWMYYDPFLRMLYVIGKTNAALLTTLTITGPVKIHHCHRDVCGREGCEDDIIESLRLYIPFFNRFCTNLRHLTISATLDAYPPGNPYPLQPGELSNRDEALRPFLENEIHNILSLETLEVIDEYNQPLDIAKLTIDWVKDRANERASLERKLCKRGT